MSKLSESRGWTTYARQFLRNLPADAVVVVVVLALMTLISVVPELRVTPVQLFVGFVFIVFVPGYSVTAALFPKSSDESSAEIATRITSRYFGGISVQERVALSLGLSAAVVSLVGLLLTYTSWGFTRISMVVSIDIVSLVAIAAAIRRRQKVPYPDRFKIPFRQWSQGIKSSVLLPKSKSDTIMSIILLSIVLMASVSVGYALTTPRDDERYTQLYILSETGGELQADGYSSGLSVGESESVIVGVTNREHRMMDYSVVVRVQNVRESGPVTTDRVQSFELSLDHNESKRQRVAFVPTETGDRFRLQFLLYRGDLPERISSGSAYRRTHIWFSVDDR
jgi:uncharacterized membrane protein